MKGENNTRDTWNEICSVRVTHGDSNALSAAGGGWQTTARVNIQILLQGVSLAIGPKVFLITFKVIDVIQ
jgi:hypothetical protein